MLLKDKRPEWCEDKTCSPLCAAKTEAGGKCFGKLSIPINHVPEIEGANTMSRCHYIDGVLYGFYINLPDLILNVYLIGETLRAQGLYLPKAIVNNLPSK